MSYPNHIPLLKPLKPLIFEGNRGKISGISRISSLNKSEEHGELAFLRAERAAIREFDGGMTREQASTGILDVPCSKYIEETIDELEPIQPMLTCWRIKKILGFCRRF